MDPDSPAMLKAQRIKASWEAPRKAATPEPVPQPRDYGAWLEALRQPFTSGDDVEERIWDAKP